jgi:elongation factor Ts
MTIPASLVKELRMRTGAGMMDCKSALSESDGDIEKAAQALRVKGIAKAAKGRVSTYIHPGHRIGVMLEVNCETDFVSRNDQFGEFVKDLCMHIAAASPEFVSREEVPEEHIAKEREVNKARALEMGKPENMIDKIVDGMMDKYFAEVCLLEQPFVKEPKQSVGDFVTAAIATIGENMRVRRFTRYELGK